MRVELADGADPGRAVRVLTELTGSRAEPGRTPGIVEGACDSAVKVPAIVRGLDAAGVAALDVTLHTPSLDEVFLSLTASRARIPAPARPLEVEGSMNR